MIKILLANKITKYHLFRYLVAGGTAFISEYVTFLFLFEVVHLQLYVANSVSFCTGLTVSFMLNRSWAFKQQEFRLNKHHQAVFYGTLALFNLLMTNIVIGILNHLGFDPRIGKIMAMFLIVGWNFFIFKLIIFKGKNGDE